MKDIKGTIKFYNTNLVKKALGTGAFILVAGISSSKPITIMCSVGAGLAIANIASKLKERRNEHKSITPKKSKRSIILEKLKELKNELLETTPELSEKKNPVASTPKVVNSTSKMDFSNPTEDNLRDPDYLSRRAKANGGRLTKPNYGNPFGLLTEEETEFLKSKGMDIAPVNNVSKSKPITSDPLGAYIEKQKQLKK